MVTVEQAVVTGYKILWKHKKLVLVPLLAEGVRLLCLLFGLSLGGFGAGTGQFFLPMTLPKTWFSLDDILPLPILGPSLVGAFYPTLQLTSQVKMLIFFSILPVVALSAYLKSGYLYWIKEVFAGNRLTVQDFIVGAKELWHNMFVLELLILIGNLVWWHVFQDTGAYAPFVQKSGITLIHIFFIFTSPWMVYCRINILKAMRLSVGSLLNHGALIIPYALWGTVINGMVAIPLNWAIGTTPGLLLATFIYSAVATGLSVGLMYLFTGLEYDPDWPKVRSEKVEKQQA